MEIQLAQLTCEDDGEEQGEESKEPYPLVLGGLAHGGDEADREQEGAAAEQ